MRVEVVAVDESEGTRWIEFKSDAGGARVQWAGSDPEVGSSYHVELASDVELHPGENVARIEATSAAIAASADGITITAQLGRLFDETLALLTLGAGHLMLVVEPSADFWVPGDWYTFTLPDLVLHDSRI